MLIDLSEFKETTVNLKRSVDFLKHYICVDCKSIDAEADSFHIKFENINNQRDRPDYYQKLMNGRIAKVQKDLKNIYRGHNLLNEFKETKNPIGGLIYQSRIYNYSYSILDILQKKLLSSNQHNYTSEFGIEESNSQSVDIHSFYAVNVSEFANFTPEHLCQIRHSVQSLL